MDAFAQLALMAKAKRVFGSPETFLSFPALSPLSRLPDELRFGSAGDMTAQDLAEASEFARITNQIPRSIIAPIDEGEYLWDVYREILQTARVARGVMTSAEQHMYDNALSVLYAAGEGGLRTDSEQLRTYKQHRDALIEAQEEYKNQQLTAEASTDQTVLDQWHNVDEPRLRLVVQERENAWAISGFKSEIEAAQQVELASAAGAASSVWDEWRGSFLDDLDLATDTNQIRFAITGYSPYDIFDADDWPRFTLTAEEMTQLGDQAPAEFRKIFAAGSTTSEIASVSFEYRSVAVTRPWFRQALFKARFWKLPDGSEPLSDGAEMPMGRCPAYVSALVFARNVAVTYKERPSGGPEDVGHPTRFLRLDATMLSPQMTHLAMRASPAHAVVVSPAVTMDGGRATRRLRSMNFAVAAAAQPMVIGAPVRAVTTGRAFRTMVARPRFDGAVLTAPAPEIAPAPEPARLPEPEPPPPPTRVGEVIFLAFICKRVPRSPDPDPALPWD